MQALYIGAGVLAGGLATYLLSRQGCVYAESKPPTVERSLGTSQVARFPWGSNSFEIKFLPACWGFAAVSVAAAVAASTPSGPIGSLELARGPVLASLLWIWGFYNQVSSQIKVKMGGGNEQGFKVAERSMYNSIEQGVPFLALMWMTAACVDSAIATSCGTLYSALRMHYGLAYSYYGGFSLPVEFITQPNYMVNHLFAASLLYFGFTGNSLFDKLGTSFLVWCPLMFVGNIFAMAILWDFPTGQAAAQLNLAYNRRTDKTQ